MCSDDEEEIIMLVGNTEEEEEEGGGKDDSTCIKGEKREIKQIVVVVPCLNFIFYFKKLKYDECY